MGEKSLAGEAWRKRMGVLGPQFHATIPQAVAIIHRPVRDFKQLVSRTPLNNAALLSRPSAAMARSLSAY
jgi:hypothetical protein